LNRTKNSNKNSRQRNCHNKHMEQLTHEEFKEQFDALKVDNDFGAQTYWNRPTGLRPTSTRHKSRYAALKTQTTKRRGKPTSPAISQMRSPSPTLSQQSKAPSIIHQPVLSPPIKPISTMEADDAKDEKAIQKVMKSKLPEFSDEKDWESAIFELKLVLDRVWPHKDTMDIVEYLTTLSYHKSHLTRDMATRADNLIYYVLTMSAKKDSYAKMQILAACHRDAIPCVMVNEGKKLYQLFQSQFTMATLHQASLPTVRVEFYAITQNPTESILAYTSRVDIIVSTLAKLGEKVSTGAWIYALGNGLRHEYKECKDGILYNKPGFDSVLSVKTKLLSEEAILTSKKKKESDTTRAAKAVEDEIALKIRETKLSTEKTLKDPADKALMFKGKGNKGGPNGKGTGKGRQWHEAEWTPRQGKGRQWNEPG
jgi:hypothetical protein